ncbi:MAG TPA: hypothetical protein VEY93_09270 [Longimicrobium sp.]|nr:hypothetical protein [Longimicrobium sp.]
MTDGFGAALLTPSGGKALASGLVDVRWWPFPDSPNLLLRRGYLHVYATTARSSWRLADTASKDTLATSTVTTGLGALLSADIGRGRVGNNPVALSFGFGISGRGLGGDLSSDGHSAFRKRVLGTDDLVFWGWEFGSEITFGKISGALQYYTYAGSLDGVSRSQVVAVFSIAAPIFEGNLSEVFYR